MKRDSATIIGFFVAPLTPPVILAVLSPMMGAPHISVLSSIGFGLISYGVSLAITLVFAVPLFLLLLRYSLVALWSILLVGFFIGALVGAIFSMFGGVKIYAILMLGGIGVASAFSFWLIWRLGR
ncbi:MAG TPA: hypothetical protein VJ890_13700 [Vineibacter sp.]|nr:hypothetical protein [Vineibacter sp.]